ncbi:MAG: transglutaminase domain-containing protein [Candidatus Aenigmarchaeota archaeon]|nr:transglutaminase domain-containing protein [Candidatus Aenigmarchaeota archaeon]
MTWVRKGFAFETGRKLPFGMKYNTQRTLVLRYSPVLNGNEYNGSVRIDIAGNYGLADFIDPAEEIVVEGLTKESGDICRIFKGQRKVSIKDPIEIRIKLEERRLRMPPVQKDKELGEFYEATQRLYEELRLGGKVRDDLFKILGWMREHLTYDLDAAKNMGLVTPINRIIKERKGNCNQFADFLRYFLRMGSHYARSSGRYVINRCIDGEPLFRSIQPGKSEEHKWVEFFDGEGWHTVDPTVSVVSNRPLDEKAIDRGLYAYFQPIPLLIDQFYFDSSPPIMTSNGEKFLLDFRII